MVEVEETVQPDSEAGPVEAEIPALTLEEPPPDEGWTEVNPALENATSRATRLDLPFTNLVLSGYLGVGKSTVAVEIARALEVDVMDLDDAIELQEMMSISKIREQYGDSRLKKLEHDLCRKAALMRRSVIVVPGAALLDSRNYPLLSERGIIAVITCELGEALRRLHQGSALHFRDRTLRGRMIGRIRREYKIISDPAFLQLDTTHLSITEQRDILINLWLTGKPNHPLFRTGPGPQIKPPPRNPVGLTNLTQAEQRKKPGRRFQDEQLS